ncbi:hypothetical protein NPIL_286321, partial [Nephila pilipes]
MENLWTPDDGFLDQIASDVTGFPLKEHRPTTIFETPDNCAICTQTMHWAEKT